MCSREEVHEEIQQATVALEKQFEARLDETLKIYERINEDGYKAVAKTVSEFGREIQEYQKINSNAHDKLGASIDEMNKKISGVDWESLKTWSDLMRGTTTFKSFITGLASVFVAVGSIGAALIWFIRTFK